MPSTRPPKKNDTIEIRLPDAVKSAFMQRCQRQQRSASEAIRAFIDAELAPPPTARSRRKPGWRLAAAALVGAGLGVGVAAPSLAQSAPTNRPAFDRLDRNHDGVLDYAEFEAR